MIFNHQHMKKLITACFSLMTAALIMQSCEKDENKIFYEDGTPPVLTASTTAVNLQPPPADQAAEAIRFGWTNPNYVFTTGLSSQDVTYRLEFDTAGANFGSNAKYTTTIARDLGRAFSVGELNSILGNTMSLTFGRQYRIEARVISSIGTEAIPLTSNVTTFTARPFAPPPKVPVPTNGTLWITGDAAPSGWSNPLGAPYDVSQKFTAVSSTLYELVLSMPGGGGYKLIQAQGDWGTQYHMLNGGTWNAGSFEKRDADPAFPGPPAAGTYKISVDFQKGQFSVVKQ